MKEHVIGNLDGRILHVIVKQNRNILKGAGSSRVWSLFSAAIVH